MTGVPTKINLEIDVLRLKKPEGYVSIMVSKKGTGAISFGCATSSIEDCVRSLSLWLQEELERTI